LTITLEENYSDEVILLGNIIKRYNNLGENDINGAYQLSKDSLQVYNRFSTIKYDIKKQLTRGQEAALKDRLKEICDYLLSVSTHSRMVWKYAKESLFNHKEDL